MRVTVETFGLLDPHKPNQRHKVEVQVSDDATVLDVLVHLGVDPDQPWNASINGTLAEDSDRVTEGSSILVFPPISGGGH